VPEKVFNDQATKPGIVKNIPPDAVVLYNSANLKYNRSDFKGALSDFDSAILIQPGYAKAYNNRGILKASAFKDYAGAIKDFDKAIEINPGYGDAYLGRGTVYFLARNLDAACKDWGTARSLGNTQAARLIGLHCNR
jgi:tetratricopeptide (TPR) repeat protein